MREIAICNDDFCNCAIIVSIKQLGDVAMRFRLVAFADEAAPDLAGQIEAMQENGVELLEIRGVDGQNIDGISATKAKVILTEMFFFAYFRDIVCYHRQTDEHHIGDCTGSLSHFQSNISMGKTNP